MRVVLGLTVLLAACAPASRGLVPDGTPDAVNLAKARARSAPVHVTWLPWSEATFAKARATGKPLLLDGAAEWCHWCHVMDETTYSDPAVVALIEKAFTPVRVDIDERPDIAERYVDWGWPATILLSPDASTELAKYRGYLPAERMREVLEGASSARGTAVTPSEQAGSVTELSARVAWAAARIDAFFDPKHGGWGRGKKAPVAMNVQLELSRADRGDSAARKRVTLTLEKQRALLDPVWGGLYQYAAKPDWSDPHFEKLMTIQAPNLEAYVRAGEVDTAKRIAAYLDAHLSGEDGAFFVAQDADVGAHDKSAPFVDGHVLYAGRTDAARRKLGVPWVDRHVYPRENGLAISALVALHGATGDPAVLTRAKRSADLMLATVVGEDGAVKRAGSDPRFLVDAASLGRGLVLLGRAAGEKKYADAAARIAGRLALDFADGSSGGYVDATRDPDAAGLFALPRRSVVGNVAVARFFALLDRRAEGLAALASVGSEASLAGEGLWLGDFVLAHEELTAP